MLEGLDLTERADRAGALYRALRDELELGTLAAGQRMPSSRALAHELSLSRTTVSTVFERLVAEGFLEARVGAGTFVTAVARTPAPSRRAALTPRTSWRWCPQQVSAEQPTPPADFRVGIPDAGLFPFDTWRRILAAESRLRQHSPGTYAEPGGLPRLREAIARHLGHARGLRVDAGDVLVTSGAQQAVDLIARVLLEPGDVVAVEDPGYGMVRDLVASHGARVVPVPVDCEGLVVSEVPAEARLIYTTPTHQYPLGVQLSLARRRALLAHAAAHDAAIIEDDYDSEFRYTGRPLEPLHRLDADGRVLYVGTFSKSLLPSLRLGYLIAPPSVREALLAAKQLSDGYGPIHVQAALARFLEEGLLSRHVRRATAVYAERRSALLDELGRLPVEIVSSEAGLHLAAHTDRGRQVAERARQEGIAIVSLTEDAAGPVRDGLVFGYGATVTPTITPALRRPARLLEP